MTTDRIGVAIISMSGQQGTYAQTLYENPRVDVVAVTDDDPPAAEEQANRAWADEHGVPFVPDLDAVLARDDVQAVSLCSTFDRRVALVEKAAAAGKHILADKPLTETLADGDAIIDAVDRAGVKMMVGHNFTFNAAILEARESLRRGDVGLPWAIHSEWVIATGRQAAGIGELRNHGMYPLDAILYLVPERVRERLRDHRRLLLRQRQGGGRRRHGVHHDGDGPRHHRHDVPGQDADSPHERLRRRPDDQDNGHPRDALPRREPAKLDGPRPLGYASNAKYGPAQPDAMVEHFVSCILEDRQPMSGPRAARDILEITLAALQSSRENRVVHLPLPA